MSVTFTPRPEAPTDARRPSPGGDPLRWRHGFAALGGSFFTPLQPTSLPAPDWASGIQISCSS